QFAELLRIGHLLDGTRTTTAAGVSYACGRGADGKWGPRTLTVDPPVGRRWRQEPTVGEGRGEVDEDHRTRRTKARCGFGPRGPVLGPGRALGAQQPALAVAVARGARLRGPGCARGRPVRGPEPLATSDRSAGHRP